MLAIIGGSGLYKVEGLEVLQELEVKTPFGEPSSPIIKAKYKDYTLFFLARHGRRHQYPPHKVPYRANVWALKTLGVKYVIGVNAVGGINKFLKAGDFVIVDQFLDFTKGRTYTFYEGKFSPSCEGKGKYEKLLLQKKVVHIDVTEPFCPTIRGILKEVLTEKGFPYHYGGTYVATEGPRLETAAEIRMFTLLGCDVVGMTMVPEVVLAKELEMHYAGLCVVTNPAAGLKDEKLTSEEVINLMRQKEEQIKEVILQTAERVYNNRNWKCQCESTLQGAEV
ncbi:MAG TPA: S-methyl-5'-thioadenosine phosphorylase [Aquifex aeolicus]|uniref:Probable 6-oxopurine nucleoside phosphorylase n=1 Tax=Aquifex aeolicus TaxID=63363 RepID=A0A9D1CGN6_AQUAO|nr:S-methyl-5'-thioadenosine phosphorylase [Aquificales bacterium]HIP98723.1 S-methyl-5'-thioadenosine phosphorylase [Aquifex aeolicus]HIQ25913.1 S-methyl-5'-thioadenosine phosphorylase [Aquifex aeolicus]